MTKIINVPINVMIILMIHDKSQINVDGIINTIAIETLYIERIEWNRSKRR